MSKVTASVLIAIILLLIGLSMCAYTVQENEQAIILAFGEVVGKPVTEPGLHFKIPWYEARKFDKRWLAWDGDPNQITTLDKRYILINVFARWRIVDPLAFIAKLRDEQSAQGRLDDILDSATRNVIANHKLIEAIRSTNRQFEYSKEELDNRMQNQATQLPTSSLSPSTVKLLASQHAASDSTDSDLDSGGSDSDSGTDSVASGVTEPDQDTKTDDLETASQKNSGSANNQKANDKTLPEAKDLNSDEENIYNIQFGRQKLTDLILQKAAKKVKDLGIEIKDVRFKRIDYIPSVQKSVFDRMVSERLKVAARLRSQGDGLSAEILGRKERDLKKIRSQAYKKAEEIKGDADAEAAQIYASAYKRDPSLYRFLKTLESYQKTMDQKTMLLMTTKSDYASFLKSQK